MKGFMKLLVLFLLIYPSFLLFADEGFGEAEESKGAFQHVYGPLGESASLKRKRRSCTAIDRDYRRAVKKMNKKQFAYNQAQAKHEKVRKKLCESYDIYGKNIGIVNGLIREKQAFCTKKGDQLMSFGLPWNTFCNQASGIGGGGGIPPSTTGNMQTHEVPVYSGTGVAPASSPPIMDNGRKNLNPSSGSR